MSTKILLCKKWVGALLLTTVFIVQIASFGFITNLLSAPQVSAHAPDVSLTGFGTATIDGVLSPGEWDNAGTLDFAANLPTADGGGTTPATLLVMNDATNLYFGLTIIRASFGGATNPGLEFDNDHDGVREDGDDVRNIYYKVL